MFNTCIIQAYILIQALTIKEAEFQLLKYLKFSAPTRLVVLVDDEYTGSDNLSPKLLQRIKCFSLF